AATGFSWRYKDILSVGSATGCRSQAERVVAELAARLERIAKKTASEYRPRVFCLSWFDPLMSAGAWITQMVRLAGGDARVGSEREASSRIAVDQLRGESPEVIFLLPCSFSQSRTADAWTGRRDLSPWRYFPAVCEGLVFVLVSSLLHRTGSRLVDGVEFMAVL